MQIRSLLILLFLPPAAYAQLTLDLARASVYVTATAFLNPPSMANAVQGNHNVAGGTFFDGATTYSPSYTSTAVQGGSTVVITEAFTSTVNANSTQITGTLDLNSPTMNWTSTIAEVPYAGAGTGLLITFTAWSDFTYNIGLVSTGVVTNNGVTTSPSRTLVFRNLTTSQNIITDFTATNATYINTLPAGQYQVNISSSYGGPFAADSDGSAWRSLSASVNITAVPEPSTTALLAALAALGVIAAKRLSSSRLPPANLGTFPTDKIPCV